MRHIWTGAAAIVALTGCAGTGVPLAGGGGSSDGFREFMVIGSSMSFEDCRSRGGLIIRDANSPMTACDPSVKRNPVPMAVLETPATATDLNAALEQQELDQGR